MLWRPSTSRGSEEPPGDLRGLTGLGAAGRWLRMLPREQRAALLCSDWSPPSSLGGRDQGEADCRPGRSWDRALALRAVCPGAHPCLPLHLSYRRLINGGDEAHICGCCVDGEVCYLPSGSPDAERVLALPGWMEHCAGSQEPWGLSPSPPRTFLPSGPQFPYPMVRWLRLEDL